MYNSALCRTGFLSLRALICMLKVQVSHREKPYQCVECGRRFLQRSSLENHLKVVHLKIKDYVCKLCSKAFGTKENLKTHTKRIHNEDFTQMKIINFFWSVFVFSIYNFTCILFWSTNLNSSKPFGWWQRMKIWLKTF